MKFNMTKIAAGLVLAATATGAQAATTHYITNMSIVEISASSSLATADASNVGGVFYFGAEAGDGLRPTGVPVFNSTGTTTAATAALAPAGTSWVGAAVGINPGATGGIGAAQISNEITSGFNYSGLAFDVDTLGVSAVIDNNSTLVLNVDGWGGYWAGSSSFGPFRHILNPDAGTLVTSLENVGGVWYYTADWSHVITLAEDENPLNTDTGYNGFADQRADWHLEGVLTVTPVPEASTYGMMLAGLGLVGGMVARRRKLMA